MPASELIENLVAVLDEFRPRFGGRAASELDELISRLRNPVRVAVIGRVKAGKSTLVNALLGQRVAPTDVSECTKVVTWFHYGHPQRAEVHLLDGRIVPRPLAADGHLPEELGVPLEEVKALHAFLANEALKDLTLIDTPGIASTNDHYSASTERLLAESSGGRGTTDQTDAVVFLMNQVVMAEEMEALEGIKERAGSADSALSTVGVLSKADKLGDGDEDPWPVAVALANRFSGQFRDQVATVVPVIGLVAETAETAGLTEADAKAIRALAQEPPAQLERAMWSADRFVSAELAVTSAARERLLGLLDLYGIHHAVEMAREGTIEATAIRRKLSILSGISEVKRALLAYFGEKDHVLKVRSAFAVAEKVSYLTDDARDPTAAADLRARLEELKLDPVMHPLNELEVWQQCRSGHVSLPAEMLEEIERLASTGTLAARAGVVEGDPGAVAEAARQAMGRWRTFMVTEADPEQAHVARVVIRSYQLIWTAARDAATAVSG